jgi:hypothetical protein
VPAGTHSPAEGDAPSTHSGSEGDGHGSVAAVPLLPLHAEHTSTGPDSLHTGVFPVHALVCVGEQ